MKVLLVGESWAMLTMHQKGVNPMWMSGYEEGGAPLLAALDGHADTTYIRTHEVAARFPDTAEELAQYDVVLLSDVGADTFLLHPETMLSKFRPNRLRSLEQYVANGGGVAMVGGWMSFGGIAGSARYHHTPISAALPVLISPYDDREETPEGVRPMPAQAGHPILAGISGEWPRLLGYNRFEAKPGASVVATVGEDPFLVVGTHGKGRALAYASDCSPHWAPPEFIQWEHYNRLWRQIVGWLAGASSQGVAEHPQVHIPVGR